MGREEQQEEREVLDSIFPDEITDISDTAYRIQVALDVPSHDDEEEEQPILLLHVSYPEAYPDIAPDLDLSNPPNAPKHPLLSVQEDKAHLLESLQPSVEENLGMAMIFTLVSTLKDTAEQLIQDRQAVIQASKDREAAKVQEEEDRKFHGTAVTRESFLEWRDKFRQEMADEEERRRDEKEAEDKKKRISEKERKMTGRQLWEGGMVGKIDEDEEGEDGLAEVEKLKIEN